MRRTIIAVALIAFTGRAWAGDGTTFRGDAAHTGVYAGPAIAAPVLRWKFHTGGQVIASPAIANGTVYIGATDGKLYALDERTGAQRWTFQTHARIAATAAIANGVVYFGSYDNTFYALDAASGAVKWKYQTGPERRFAAPHIHGTLPAGETMPDPFDFYMSSPLVWQGAVYFGGGDGKVTALDAATGAVRWTFQTGNVVHASPAIADVTLYIGSWDTFLYALDAATGQEKWRFKTGDDKDIYNQTGIQGSAAISEGVVYFGCRDSNFYAVDARTGHELWRRNNKGSWVIASPAVRGGMVVDATSDSGGFFVHDAKSGAERFTLSFEHWPMFSSPALVGDTAYIGSHQGKLFAIDLKTHAVRWAFETDGSKANLATYRAADGAPNYAAAQSENFYDKLVVAVDRMMTTGAVLSSPVPDNGLVIFGSMDGNVYALSGDG